MLKNFEVLIIINAILYFTYMIESLETKPFSIDMKNVSRKHKNQSNTDIGENARDKARDILLLDAKKRDENEVISKENNKYNILRKDLEELLKIVASEEVTKSALTDALHQITAELISNECLWKMKFEAENPKTNKTINGTGFIVKYIQATWNKILPEFYIPIGIRHNKTMVKDDAMLRALRQLVSHIHDDNRKLKVQYAIKCDFVNKFNKIETIKELEANTEEAQAFVEHGNCSTQICSTEFLDFLTDIYSQLSDTLSDESNNDTGSNRTDRKSNGGERIRKCFFDAPVKKFFDDTVNRTIKFWAKHNLTSKMKKLWPFRTTMADDLLYKIAKIMLKHKICTVFESCNDLASMRKSNNRDNESTDHKSLDLKLKLEFDKDPLKTILNLFNSRDINGTNNYRP